MVTYEVLFLIINVFINIVTLCYLVFKNDHKK